MFTSTTLYIAIHMNELIDFYLLHVHICPCYLLSAVTYIVFMWMNLLIPYHICAHVFMFTYCLSSHISTCVNEYHRHLLFIPYIHLYIELDMLIPICLFKNDILASQNQTSLSIKEKHIGWYIYWSSLSLLIYYLYPKKALIVQPPKVFEWEKTYFFK